MAKQTYIDRPPRIQPELPRGERDIPNPPENDESPGILLQQAALPIITIVGYVLVATLNPGGRSSLLMIPMGLSVLASVALAFYVARKEKQAREERDGLYARRLMELRREMENSHAMQRHFHHYNYPPLERSLALAQDLGRPGDKAEDIRSGTRLWERRPSDPDFSVLRLGLGSLPSSVTYKLSQGEKYENPLIRQALRLADDSRFVSGLPVTIPLRLPPGAKPEEKAQYSVRHSIGISGGDPQRVYQYIQSLLVDYTTYQSPADTRLYIIGTHPAKQHWRWAYPLPHCKENDGSETLAFEEEEKPLSDKEADRLRVFWKNLRVVLENRKIRLEDKDKSWDVTIPFLLVVVDLLEAAPEWSSLKDPESEAAISTILMDGQRLGAAILFLVPDRAHVPSLCQAVLEVDADPQTPDQAVFRYAEVDLNTFRYMGSNTLVTSPETARSFARALEPYTVRAGYGSNLASTVTLLDINNLANVDELVKFALENWRACKVPENADWLNVAVGVLSGNEVRKLAFSAKADGVHGLIAGSTGSGKSELLMTLILGLAVMYDPSVCNFVLIDYKGGAAFDPFKKLPHKVDIVTNLDAAATGRVFASIIAELERRQKLNTHTQSKDIVHYRTKGLALKDPTPYPHLFVIIDEFAEMISNNAEFKAQLESITRLGRALGVHLILAAQRPVGVTDQMRANIKFRICLRVETPDDSRELLRRSDAAFLPPGIPGRGYLQVGNENIEMIQTAYTGGAYKGPQEENADPDVIWLDRPPKSAQQSRAEPPKLYEVIVDQLAKLAEQESKPQWRPWPAFLPRVISLENRIDTAYMSEADVARLRLHAWDVDDEERPPLNGAVRAYTSGDFCWKGIRWDEGAMRPLIGLIDNPYQASQSPLSIDFNAGHAVIFGASGWGKTTFLQSVIVSLTATHSPDELHIYILDFGGRAMEVFDRLPHVGAIITSDEDERIQRLLRKLNDIVEERQRLFSQERADSLVNYNLQHPDAPLPAILVVIDNFAEFKEYFENLLGPLISLVRECRAYGIHFLISADLPNSLTNKLYNLISERMTLKLSDPSEYSTVVGRGATEMSPIPGRGFIRMGNMPLEFQSAVPFTPREGDPNIVEKLRRFSQDMADTWNRAWKGKPPITIETLPSRVLLSDLLKQPLPAGPRRVRPLIGIDDRNLEPYFLDLEKLGPHMVVIGTPLAGKTTTLRTIALSLAAHYPPDEVMLILVDLQQRLFRYGGEHTLEELPHVVQSISEVGQLDELLENLKVECASLEARGNKRRIFMLIDDYDGFGDEANRSKTLLFEELAMLVRKYQTMGFSVVAGGSIAMMNQPDDLRKIITASNFGLGLKNAEAVNRLNGRYPRSLAEVELPNGRGFMIRSGITSMLQVATPLANDDEVEASLDAWVTQICQRHPGVKLAWSRKPEEEEQRFDLDVLKPQLVEKGLPQELLDSMDYHSIVDMAREYNLIPAEGG